MEGGNGRVWASLGGDREGGLWPLTQHISWSLKVTQQHIGRLQEKLGPDRGAHRAPAQAYSTLAFFPCFKGPVEPERGATQDLRGKEERAGMWGTDSQNRVQQARAL